MRFGPTAAVFRGEATLAFDHEAHRCTIEGRGIDQRGASRALSSGAILAQEEADATLLTVSGSFTVTGPLETFANAGGVHLARALLAEFSAQHGEADRGAPRRRTRGRAACAREAAEPADAAPPTAAARTAATGRGARDQRRPPALAGPEILAAQPFRQQGETLTMSTLKVSDMLAQAFRAEGCEMLFTLMGDANMYWSEAMARQPGCR